MKMLRYNMSYQNYNPYINNYYNPYNNISSTYYHHYTSNIPNTYDEFYLDKINKDDSNVVQDNEDAKENSSCTDNSKTDRNTNNKSFKIGPLSFSKESINIFGFDIQIDDLILIGLILFLLIQSDCDYILIIVLGLILFNVSFDLFNIFK